MKFKVGPVKAKEGTEGVISEILGTQMFGRVRFGTSWCALCWDLNGKWGGGGYWDLLPNVEPMRAEFMADVFSGLNKNSPDYIELPPGFTGKRIRVAVEEI